MYSFLQSFFPCWKLILCISERANIVKTAIALLNETGIVVVSVTCDNPATNWSMMTKLGAKLSSPDPKVSLDLKNILNVPILVIFDVCHLLKLLRNTLGDYKTLLDDKSNTINWNNFENLVNVQTSQGLHLANRLRTHHIDYKTNKMKTALAAQTFSKSVATSLSYCKDSLKLKEFEDSEPTINFVKNINDLFDLLNSKSKFGKGCKAPLSKENFELWSSKFHEMNVYISSLKHTNGESVLKGARKATFLGFLVALKSFRYMFELYVLTNHLQYILTFKFSQDHLGKESITFVQSCQNSNYHNFFSYARCFIYTLC